ncbi:hypothetical protein PM082_020052 [Marasmius tenuissimus]|nr:hypothetical protein PM082_020052 [Marasmius tenuissimus]
MFNVVPRVCRSCSRSSSSLLSKRLLSRSWNLTGTSTNSDIEPAQQPEKGNSDASAILEELTSARRTTRLSSVIEGAKVQSTVAQDDSQVQIGSSRLSIQNLDESTKLQHILRLFRPVGRDIVGSV